MPSRFLTSSLRARLHTLRRFAANRSIRGAAGSPSAPGERIPAARNTGPDSISRISVFPSRGGNELRVNSTNYRTRAYVIRRAYVLRCSIDAPILPLSLLISLSLSLSSFLTRSPCTPALLRLSARRKPQAGGFRRPGINSRLFGYLTRITANWCNGPVRLMARFNGAFISNYEQLPPVALSVQPSRVQLTP